MAKAKWKLPDGFYRTTVEELVGKTLPPVLGPLTRENAWKYVLACTLRAQKKDGKLYLHVNDQLKTAAGKRQAEQALDWLKPRFVPGKDPLDWIDLVGRAYEAERVKQGFSPDVQRNNLTGRAFETVIQELIQRLCGVRASREPRLRDLQGFELAPLGYHSRPDLALFDARNFRFLISTKWTLRKERVGTYLHEAHFYRQRRADLQIGFVLNDFNLNIWHHLVTDPLVDRGYHVHLPWLLGIHQPFADADGTVKVADLTKPGRVRNSYERWLEVGTRVHDLSDLFADVDRLKADVAPTDPEDTDDAEDDDEE